MVKKESRTNGKKSELQGIQKEKQIAKSGAVRKDAHISSRNKRDQAKRDVRSAPSN